MRIGHGQHRERVAEAVAEVAEFLVAAGGPVRSGRLGLPPARVDAVNRGAGEGEPRVAVRIDSVVDDGGQVLVAGDVKREGFANLAQRRVAQFLGPAVGIVVGAKPLATTPVRRGHRGEGRLRDDRLHVGPAPIGGPRLQEAQLPLAEQLEARQVCRVRVEAWVHDVVTAAAGCRHFPLGSRLELTVGQDGETDPAVHQRPVIDSDALPDGSAIVTVGVVRRLGSVDHIHPRRRHFVAARSPEIRGWLPHPRPRCCPGRRRGRRVSKCSAGRASGLATSNRGDTTSHEVEDRRVERRAPYAVASARLIELIAGECEQVGIQPGHLGDVAGVGKRRVQIARDSGNCD